MTPEEYFTNEFHKDLSTITFYSPNQAILKNPTAFHLDANTVFFGGKEWEKLEDDIAFINRENYQHFFLCLFITISIDLTMYTYYRSCYRVFRNRMCYPKFGWCGFGPHFENPCKLLDIPYQKGFIDPKAIDLEAAADLFIKITTRLLNDSPDFPKVQSFLTCMLSDKDFRPTENTGLQFSSIILSKLQAGISTL